MLRTLVSKPFNIDDPTLVSVVREEHDGGAIVEYPLPAPRIALDVDKTMFIADGTDKATITARFESCDVVDNELVWTPQTPAGDVTFTTNLRPTTVTVDASGHAVLEVASTTARVLRITATLSGYTDAQTSVEAV